jgi:hypothetical protein
MKPVNRRLDDDALKVILMAERANALGSEQSSDLSDQRIRAFEYYMGDMAVDMPAEDGQSSAVSTDVQDVVEGALPIILDVLSGGEKIVEFNPSGEGDEDAAEQETDYVNHVFMQKNPGFLTLYTAIKDGLLSKNCYVKWWMEKSEARTREHYKGLTEDAFAVLAADTDINIVDLEQVEEADPLTQQPVVKFNVVAEITRTKLEPKIAAFPPEEFLISKNARDVPNAPYLAHVQRKAQADVINEFPDKAELIRSAPAANGTIDNFEATARQTVQDEQDLLGETGAANTDMRMIEVVEHFIRLPMEKDEVPRRYKITTCGTKNDVLDIEEVSAWNIASGTPIIMPHRHFGRALADLVIDVQQVKTSLLRATLNNAYFANNQRVEVSETHASENTIDDLLNNRVGGIVRTKMPGGLKTIETQPIGHWVAPIIEYMDGIRDNRTGVSKNNTGLDADSMSHARPGAVNRIMDAAEMRMKLISRVFAETLIVDMFRGLHRMLQEYSEEAEVVKLRGKWVKVDPREWKNRHHMTVSLPLGGVSKQQMIQFFSQMLSVQEKVIQQQGGPDGPLVSYKNIYHTLESMMKLAGVKSCGPYFMEPGDPNPNAPKPPDPRMVEAQAKAQATQQQTQAKIEGDKQEFEHETQMEQLRLQMQRQRDQDDFRHKQQLDQMKFAHDAQMAKIEAMFDMQLEHFKASEQIKIDQAQAAQQAKQGVGEV